MLDRIDVQNDPVNFIDPWGLASAGQLGIGNPGSYGGENTCESMRDDLQGSLYKDSPYRVDPQDIIGMLPIGGVGKLTNIKRIASGKNIRKLQEIVRKWGGRGKDWRKMKGFDKHGKELHWYQKRGDGTKYGIKQKGDLDPF